MGQRAPSGSNNTQRRPQQELRQHDSRVRTTMMLIHQVKEDVKRLARLAASVSEAHTAAIFLPTGLLTSHRSTTSGEITSTPAPLVAEPIPLTHVVGTPSSLHGGDPTVSKRASIELVGAVSQSTLLARDCRIPVGAGLIGWVAENSRPIHVAPFEMDSSSLGIYSDSEAIKSLVAVPITLSPETPEGRPTCGVLMCDSRKALSFTKQQIKQLEDVALQTSRLLYWALFRKESTSTESSWQTFTYRTEQLAEAIGTESVEVLRIAIQNFPQLEEALGISATVQHTEQFVRLVQQALPPHFPVIRIPSGEILVALDNMMSAFFQQKIRALAARPGQTERGFVISIATHSAKRLPSRTLDIDQLLKHSVAGTTSPSPVITSKVVGGGPRA